MRMTRLNLSWGEQHLRDIPLQQQSEAGTLSQGYYARRSATKPSFWLSHTMILARMGEPKGDPHL